MIVSAKEDSTHPFDALPQNKLQSGRCPGIETRQAIPVYWIWVF